MILSADCLHTNSILFWSGICLVCWRRFGEDQRESSYIRHLLTFSIRVELGDLRSALSIRSDWLSIGERFFWKSNPPDSVASETFWFYAFIAGISALVETVVLKNGMSVDRNWKVMN